MSKDLMTPGEIRMEANSKLRDFFGTYKPTQTERSAFISGYLGGRMEGLKLQTEQSLRHTEWADQMLLELKQMRAELDKLRTSKED